MPRLSLDIGERGLSVSAFAVGGVQQQQLIPWDAIARIAVFKREVYSHEMVCLLVELADGGTLELDETMSGWQTFVENLHTHLKLSMPYPEWALRVAFSAFETSPQIIFDRAAARS